MMRAALINTGTELLLGDVRDAHLSFIAQEILPLGLRLEEQRTVPDGDAIARALQDLIPRLDLLFVTGGLGPTTDDITRESIAASLGLQLEHDQSVMSVIEERLRSRRIKMTDRISQQAKVPTGAQVLPNNNGTAPGLYLRRDLVPGLASPHIFVLPGPPRELQPMFRESVMPILRTIAPVSGLVRRLYRIANMGESIVEKAIGEKILAVDGVELGYCARPGEVDVRLIGQRAAVETAEKIIHDHLRGFVFSSDGEDLEDVVVRLLRERAETVAVAESCTGGWLANRLTNVPGASEVFLAGYVTYANAAKIDVLGVDLGLIEKDGAVSEAVARAMAEGARKRAGSTYAISTTGIAGPGGGNSEKPVGLVFVGLASPNETVVKKFLYAADRPTFKDVVAQAAFDLLRRELEPAEREST